MGGGGQVFECFSYVFVLLFRYILRFFASQDEGKEGETVIIALSKLCDRLSVNAERF